MKKIVLVLCAALLIGMTACSSKESEKPVLTVSTFALSEDIVIRDVLAPFEEANDCTIVTDLGTAGDRLTKIQNNPDSGIDVIELNQLNATKAYELGLVDSIDLSKVSNAADLIEPAKKLQEMYGYGPAIVIQSCGIIYNPQTAGFEISTWEDLWKPELAGKIAVPDITSTYGVAMVHIASDYKGVDIKSDNGAAAFEALEELKPNVVKSYSKSSDLANMFASGEIVAAVVGDFAVPNIQAADANCVYVVPESGTYANFNMVDVVSTSKNKELAYKFVNWRISQELQSVTSLSLNEGPTNAKVQLTDEQASQLTYGVVAEKAKVIDYSFVNPLMESWTDQWNRILNR